MFKEIFLSAGWFLNEKAYTSNSLMGLAKQAEENYTGKGRYIKNRR